MEFQDKDTGMIRSHEASDEPGEILLAMVSSTRRKIYNAKNFGFRDVMVENVEYEIDLAE